MKLHISGSWLREDDPGEPSTSAPRLSVTDQEAEYLAILAIGCKVLEIGTGLGVSTKALARWATDVITCDIDPWVQDNIWPLLPDNVTKVSDVDLLRFEKFDLVFVDGDHNAEPVRRDLAFARSVCTGRIVFHDAKAETVWGELDGDWTLVETTHGLAVHVV